MIKFIINPNLPQGCVDKIICGTDDTDILKFFHDKNITVLANDPNMHIDSAVSTHADMAALHLGDKIIIIDKAQRSLKKALIDNGFCVTETLAEIAGEYPDDIALNFTVTDGYIAGNFTFADDNLLKLLSDKTKIQVKQGYCKCSVLVIDDKAIITDDESIYRKASENGIESLLISKGDVMLSGHEYGFIGGASGKISSDTVVFFGNIKLHRDYEKISCFLKKHGCSYICTDNNSLRDIGGIIPLTEK